MIPGVVAGQGRYAAEPPPGPVLWTPAAITTELWLDASDPATLSVSDSRVVEILDKSGRGLHLSQAVSGSRPTLMSGAGGMSFMRFNGSSTLYRGSSGYILRDVGEAMMFVLRRYSVAPSVAGTSLSVATSLSGIVRLLVEAGRTPNRNGVGGRRLDANSFQSVAGGAAMAVTWQLQCAVATWSSATLQQYIDAAPDGLLSPFQTAGNTQDTAAHRVVLGAGAALNDQMSGDIAEALVVHSDDTVLRQRIEGYMMWRHGLEANLPMGHPYKDDPPYT